MRFLLLTKTLWSEPPRLRHQLAELLCAHGHEILFLEKPRMLARHNNEERRTESNIRLRSCTEMFHHQLRCCWFQHEINAQWVCRDIRRHCSAFQPDVIVNFNYDYYFLRKLFPTIPLISVFNDDFIASARSWVKRNARNVQARTILSSTSNYAVSYPILEQLRTVSSQTELFLPWPDCDYQAPPSNVNRNRILYWGYINDRIDFECIWGILQKGISIDFYGQICSSPSVHKMLGHKNAEYKGIKPLDQMEDALQEYACSVLPYNVSHAYNRAITMNNRGFRLLSYGLPLLYSDLPHLIEAPSSVLARCRTVDDFVRAYEFSRDHFDEIQPEIQAFLEGHDAESRYKQLMASIDKSTSHVSVI